MFPRAPRSRHRRCARATCGLGARHERVIFYEEHHGDIPQRFPATSGAVRRIRVASVVFCDGQALPGTAALREVDAVPDVFLMGSGAEDRSEVGVLLDFEPAATASP